MPPTVSETAVRAAIFSQHVPQCYEQLARKIESTHALAPDSVTGRLLSGKVRALIECGDVVEIVDHDMLRRLHAYPQHFGPTTRFFMAYDHVPEVEREKLPAPPAAPIKTRAKPVALAPAAEQATAPARRKDTPPRPARTVAARDTRKPPTSTVRELDFSVPRPARSMPQAPIPAVAFSASTKQMPPVDAPAEHQLDRATKLMAATLHQAAAAIRRQAEDSLLPLNKAWLAGEAKLSPEAAGELGRLYALACDRADELDSEAAALAPSSEPVHYLTGTGR